MQRQSQLWFSGVNPFNLKTLVPEQSRWWTLGGRYGWTEALPYLRRRAECDAAHGAWLAACAAREDVLAELEITTAPFLRNIQRAILELPQPFLQPKMTLTAFDREWAPIPRVDLTTAPAALCGHACPRCFCILAEWQPGEPNWPPWRDNCEGAAPHADSAAPPMREVCEFQWVSLT